MGVGRYAMIMVALTVLASGCAGPTIKLFSDAADPLEEFTLEGSDRGKVLVIFVSGIISDSPRQGALRSRPSMVQEIVSQLRMAEEDEEVRAVLLKVDSPGGSATASDLLYHEITGFKERTGARVVVVMMNVAASGGYYVSLPADFIVAHPTTVTGSIGVVFLRPNVSGLMEKIGLDVEVNKSGKNKDMGSPFRESTGEEEEILARLTNHMAGRFLSLVAARRGLDDQSMTDVSTGRIYSAHDALKLGLVDQIGYLSDAVSKAKRLAGLPKNARVVVYRRTEYPNDNIYNTSTTQHSGKGFSLVDLGLPDAIVSLRPGFYHLWLPAAVDR
jgi:protease-4